tara:strand:+ start:970 stop:1401 length:432 start_codon:yes stop_codon:yes gene_type:complete
VNERINAFNFVSALNEMGVNDPAVVQQLYYGGVPYPVTDQRGQVWWNNNPGSVQENGYLTENPVTVHDTPVAQYQADLESIRTFTAMRHLLNTSGGELDTGAYGDELFEYRKMMDDMSHYQINDRLWDMNNWYSELFGGQGYQ